MVYLETLYGHQFGVTGIDCHRKDRPISVGDDRTARAWKLAEDSHLIFRGGAKVQAADCVSIVNEDWFLTGHQDGNVSLWFTEKKKAVSSVVLAHGAESEGTGRVGRGIASVACLRMGDVAASGSYDGLLRLWKVQTGRATGERGLSPLAEVPVNGHINSIVFGPKAKFCVLAVGQEHRLGRWNRIKKAQNRVVVVKLHDENRFDHDGNESDTEKDEPAKGLHRSSAPVSASSASSNSELD
jgi:ribosomal RNA-processing protein 9